MPPAKKAPGSRARRNRAAGARTLEVIGGGGTPELEPFDLPETRTVTTKDGDELEVAWHPATVAWWADVWRSPMAPEYLEADRHALLVLAVLVDRFWRDPTTAIAAEIRLQRQCFGLTPLDRRRLEWEIDRVDPAKRGGRDRTGSTPPPAPAKGDDPRRILASVP